MTTFDQDLTGRYVSAGADRPPLVDRRVAQAVFVRGTIGDAAKQFGIDPADLGSLAELVDAAEGHLEHISHDVNHTSVVAPTSRGETA